MNLSSKFSVRKRKLKLRWTILAFLGYLCTVLVLKEIKTFFVKEPGPSVQLKRSEVFNSDDVLPRDLLQEPFRQEAMFLRGILSVDTESEEPPLEPPTPGTPSTNSPASKAPKTSTSTTSTSTSTTTTEAPNRDNCTAPAIEQFPQPLMTSETRRSGGLIIHILATIYLFVAIAIVCDEYFVPSLEMICDRMDMSEDVAGATFMAAGSSAPELATALIAVFVAKDDIGISGVIGSAVFNILFVISVCALFAGQVVELNWWPLVRDCVCYCISICGLLLAIYNERVTWYKSLFLLFLYVCYIVLMVYNRRMEAWANTLNVPFKKATREEKSSLFGLAGGATGEKDPNLMTNSGGLDGQDYIGEGNLPSTNYGSFEEEIIEVTSPLLSESRREANNHGMEANGMRPRDNTEVEAAQPKSLVPEKRDEDANPWEMPVGLCERVVWVITLPIAAVHHVSIPDARKVSWNRWYVVTFVMSMVWIAFYSYIMIWMITIIGYTLGIPDTVMGLTLIAVGVSVPDALSSLCVVKQGFGDMAVSNAIGSNVFDILVCLGLPWFLKTAIFSPGSIVPVESRGLTYSTISLFSTVVFLIVVTHWNGWKLDKKYGVILLVWYFIFMIFASLYELNVFGEFNPPVCSSLY